jgi:hypothetical protein
MKYPIYSEKDNLKKVIKKEDIATIKKLFGLGHTKAYIGRQLGVSSVCVAYWLLTEEERKKLIEGNKKRALKFRENNKERSNEIIAKYQKRKLEVQSKEYRQFLRDKLNKNRHTAEGDKMNKARSRADYHIKLDNKVCEVCGSTDRLQRHHNDYNKPKEVVIMCVLCHHEWHKNNKPIY